MFHKKFDRNRAIPFGKENSTATYGTVVSPEFPLGLTSLASRNFGADIRSTPIPFQPLLVTASTYDPKKAKISGYLHELVDKIAKAKGREHLLTVLISQISGVNMTSVQHQPMDAAKISNIAHIAHKMVDKLIAGSDVPEIIQISKYFVTYIIEYYIACGQTMLSPFTYLKKCDSENAPIDLSNSNTEFSDEQHQNKHNFQAPGSQQLKPVHQFFSHLPVLPPMNHFVMSQFSNDPAKLCHDRLSQLPQSVSATEIAQLSTYLPNTRSGLSPDYTQIPQRVETTLNSQFPYQYIFNMNTPPTSTGSDTTPEHVYSEQQQRSVDEGTPNTHRVRNLNKNRHKTQNMITPKRRIIFMPDNIKKIINENVIVENGKELVKIGPYATKLPKRDLFTVNWSASGTTVARKLLSLLFERQTLATHTLSGKTSPAFVEFNMSRKNRLDPFKIADLQQFLAITMDMRSYEIRNTITKKCVEEARRVRQRQIRRIERETALKDEN